MDLASLPSPSLVLFALRTIRFDYEGCRVIHPFLILELGSTPLSFRLLHYFVDLPVASSSYRLVCSTHCTCSWYHLSSCIHAPWGLQFDSNMFLKLKDHTNDNASRCTIAPSLEDGVIHDLWICRAILGGSRLCMRRVSWKDAMHAVFASPWGVPNGIAE